MSYLQMSFVGGVMILVIVGIRRLCKNRLPAKTFVILWELVLLRLLLPLSVPSKFSIYSFIEILKRKWMPVAKVAENGVASDMISGGMMETVGNGVAGVIPDTAQIPMQESGGMAISIWFIVWMVGMLLCMVFFVVSYIRGYRRFCTSLPVDNVMTQTWLREHSLFRRMEIRQSDRIQAPLTYGVLHPVILMPKGFCWEEWERAQYVLTHEYVHIRRWDAVTKLLFTAALCIHWFNPLVWLMYLLVNQDMELSCDEAVIRRLGEETKSAYARTLIHMEESKSGFHPLYSHFSKNATEERIKSIMKIKKISVFAVLAAVALVAGITIVFATSAKEESAETVVTEEQDGEGGLMLMLTPPGEGMPTEDELTLSFEVEGITEEVPATLCQGDGYSICVPKEGWQQRTANEWVFTEDSRIRFWIVSLEDTDAEHYKNDLYEDGYSYVYGNPNVMVKEDEASGMTLRIRIESHTEALWCIYAVYPSEMEEGWGSRLATITDTFLWSPSAAAMVLEERAVELEKQMQELEQEAFSIQIATFAKAYFEGDTKTMKEQLSESYKGDIEVFEGSSNISFMRIVEENDFEPKEANDEIIISIEFKENSFDDFYQYLTIEMIQEGEEWKVSSYGLEM